MLNMQAHIYRMISFYETQLQLNRLAVHRGIYPDLSYSHMNNWHMLIHTNSLFK